MNKKDLLFPLAGLLLTANIGCSIINKESKSKDLQDNVKGRIENTINGIPDINNTNINDNQKLAEEVVNIKNKTQIVLSNENTKNAEKPEKLDPKKITKTLKISDIKSTPLTMKGIPFDAKRFLGYTDWEEIITKYNNPVIKNGKISSNLNDYAEITCPLVGERYKDLPGTLEEFKEKNPFFAEKIKDANNAIIVGKNKNGKYMIFSYNNGILHTASTCSPGKKFSSPEGVFRITDKIRNKRSRRHHNAPMAYAMQVSGHCFEHEGKVDGELLSLGCLRNPGFYAKELYETFPEGTLFVVYYKTQTIIF